MIQPFADRFMAQSEEIKRDLAVAHPTGYNDLVTRLINVLAGAKDGDDSPDPARITVIDHGHYQGTLLFVIASADYQPSVYWSIFVDYGSCSGCDTFEHIRGYSDEPPTPSQVNDYWTLMLHMVQQMRPIGEAA